MHIQQRQQQLLLARVSLAAFLLAASTGVWSETHVPPAVPPANAQASRFGSSWECSRGFRRAEEACVAIKVPANAYLDSSGGDWECNRGHIKLDQGCKAVRIPANAHADEQRFGAG
jgi:hypothetical protein